MIKALQLRLGNYIYSPYHGKQMQVQEISNRFMVLNDEMKLKVWFDDYVFEGIPLTPDVLEELGFVSISQPATAFRKYSQEGDSECVFLRFMEAGNHSKWQVAYTYQSRTADLKRAIRYVHELQNIYYNFTGEELKMQMPVSV